MIFDYFFLKFYYGCLKSGTPEFPRFGPSFSFGVLLVLNILNIL